MSRARGTAAWRALVRALAVTAGRSASQRALPLYLGGLILASVLFEGNGVHPADVVARALASRGDRLLLYAAWTVVSLPALHAILTTPSSFFLRTLPVPRWRMLSVQSGMLLLAELPWAYVWLRGGGLGNGAAAVVAALALGTLVLTRLERPPERVAAALLTGLLWLPSPWPLLLGMSTPIAALGIYGTWLRAPEAAAPRARAWLGGPPALALASSYGVLLARQARAALTRAAAFTLLALVAAYFAVQNTQPASADERIALSLLLLSPALILGAAGVAGPLLRAEAQLGWLVLVSGASRRSARVARSVPLALGGMVLASLHAAALGVSLRASLPLALGLWLGEAAAGALSSLLVLRVARGSLRGDGNDAGRLLIGVGAVLCAAVVSLATLGCWALLGWAALAALSLLEPGSARRRALPSGLG